MAKRKRATKKQINKKKLFEDIQKVFKEDDQLVFQIMEQKESKYYIVPAARCAFSEKKIKEIKSGK